MSQELNRDRDVCHGCSEKCCLFPTETNTNAVLSLNEIAKIEHVIGHSDFYEEKKSRYGDDVYYRLKSIAGSCCFYNQQDQKCTIYEVRPLDCRLYPFDFTTFDVGQGDIWILNNCLLSQDVDEAAVEKMLDYFECNYAEEIAENLHSEDSSFVELLKKSDGFRKLRNVKLPPSSPK
ncbi:MAG: YkgJ family cysteine cluster protein [Candidatus Electrothrix aestuarii]|uniref:YkgJ family cysteine cluster protein n=1 Tax=Candidatus Electrothrix aestuarii TaxID=3062594 RepID=A0AAU8LRM2_9BACT|nr:YkgJ family cysteine cluster protein [Candidatus Electrothrix aestuarii]